MEKKGKTSSSSSYPGDDSVAKLSTNINNFSGGGRTLIRADKRPGREIAAELSVGVREILRSPNLCWTIWWIFVFIALIIICVWHLFENIHNYLLYETVTTQMEVENKTMKLPLITFCTENWIDQDKFRKAYPDANDRDYIKQHFRFFSKKGNPPVTNSSVTNFSSQKFVQDYGLACNNITVTCFQGVNPEELLDCCPYMSKRFFNAQIESLCFSFDIPFHQKNTGLWGSFTMEMAQPMYDYPDSLCKPSNGQISSDCNWNVLLADSNTDLITDDRTFILLNSGEANLAIIHAIDRSYMAQPYGNCGEERLKYFESYSKENCESEVIARATMDTCECVKYGLLKEKHDKANLPDCSPVRLKNCFEPTLKEVKDTGTDCLGPCQETVFIANQMKHRNVPSLVMPGLSVSPNYTTAALSLQYDRLSITKISEMEKTTVSDVLSKMGSTLSLWLGFKFMTFLQSIYFTGWAILRRINGSNTT